MIRFLANRVVCWYAGHDWQRLAYVGTRCRRCSAWRRP